MEVAVTVPSLLADCTEGRTAFTLDTPARTLDGAIRHLMTAYPLLKVHLFDESERVRRHVLIFHNQDDLKRLDASAVALKPGDGIHVMQNVSGG